MPVRWTRGRRFAVVFGGILAACGGRAEVDSPSGASSDASAGAAGSGGAPVSDGGAGMPSRVGGVCPAATIAASCPSINVPLDPHTRTKDAPSGVYVEPLQAPDYGTRPHNYFPQYELPDPSTWDRSPLPVGACVFRLHGMRANCVRNGLLFLGECPAPGMTGVAPGGFYDTPYCDQHVSPGCPIADPWGAEGFWWYLQSDGANVDLVICAPECAQSIGSGRACLSLFPRP